MLLFGFIMPGIDNWAHLGGLAGGWLAAKVLDPLKPERGDHVLVALGCLAAVAAVGRLLGGRGPEALPLVARRGRSLRPSGLFGVLIAPGRGVTARTITFLSGETTRVGSPSSVRRISSRSGMSVGSCERASAADSFSMPRPKIDAR